MCLEKVISRVAQYAQILPIGFPPLPIRRLGVHPEVLTSFYLHCFGHLKSFFFFLGLFPPKLFSFSNEWPFFLSFSLGACCWLSKCVENLYFYIYCILWDWSSGKCIMDLCKFFIGICWMHFSFLLLLILCSWKILLLS